MDNSLIIDYIYDLFALASYSHKMLSIVHIWGILFSNTYTSRAYSAAISSWCTVPTPPLSLRNTPVDLITADIIKSEF